MDRVPVVPDHLTVEDICLKYLRPLSLLVIGDLVLDEYLHGEVSRIAFDRPIPVISTDGSKFQLGGAANLASNLLSLSPSTSLSVIGVVGKDIAGRSLHQLLSRLGIDTKGILVVPDKPTTHKLRVVAQDHHYLLRIDRESTEDISQPIEEELANYVQSCILSADGVIISDYCKGLLTSSLLKKITQAASSAGVPIIIDPKGMDAERYAGATALTPNVQELKTLASMSELSTDSIDCAASHLLHLTGAKALAVTLGHAGVNLYEDCGSKTIIPATDMGSKACDTNGAGDTFAAAFSLASFNGASFSEATMLGNIAAGISVTKTGTATVDASEVLQALRNKQPKNQDITASKIVTLKDLQVELRRLRIDRKTIVFTNGCFDILHAGHVEYLEAARNLGHVLIVGLNTDSSIKGIKGSQRPIMEQHGRAKVLAALQCVSFVILFDDPTPEALVDAIRPDLLVKGDDYAGKVVVGRATVERDGGSVVLIPIKEGYSTTAIIEKVITRYKES